MLTLKINHVKFVLVAILMFIMATTVLAAGESISIDAFDTNNCTPGAYAAGTVTHINGTTGVSIRFTLTNLTQGTSVTKTMVLLASGTYVYDVQVPASTVIDDVMKHKIEMLDAGAAVVAADTLNYYCGGAIIVANGSADSEPQPAFSDGRINNWDTGNPVVLFPFADGDSHGLNIYAANGDGLLLQIPAETIDAVAECPDSNTLIISDAASGISLWRLPQAADSICPFQLNAPTAEAGKIYVIIFNEMFAGTSYESWEE